MLPSQDVFSENIGRQKQIQAANWQVVNVTTPANYFHVLRRQVVREFRKPLVVMSPKSLLRHRLVKARQPPRPAPRAPRLLSTPRPAPLSSQSDMEEFLPGTRFHRFFADSGEGLVADDKIRKLILCSGKVYFDLLLEREKLGITDVALARCEQIAPFPFDHVKAEAIKYPNADIVWCQEESKNAGAWFYTRPRIITATRDVRDIRPKYAGRAPGASTSTGSAAAHKKELEALLQQAFE